MRGLVYYLGSVAALGAAAVGCAGEAGEAETAPPAAPLVSFSGPEVIKLDWTTRAMRRFDMNGDGRDDLILINNERTSIDILYQVDPSAEVVERRRVQQNRWEPVLEDALFRRERIVVNHSLFSMAVGDFNGDGRGDLVYAGRETPLTVRFQGEDSLWAESVVFDEPEPLGFERALVARDIDGDGQDDLVLLARNGLFVWLRDGDGALIDPVQHPSAVDSPFDLVLADVSGNGLLDVLYLAADGGSRLIVREQSEPGRFGPEIQIQLDGTVRELNQLQAFDEADGPVFSYLEARSGAIEIFRLKRGKVGEDRRILPEIYPIRQGTGRDPVRYARGEFIEKGVAGLAVASPVSPEVLLYQREANGFAAPLRYPSFSGISSLAALQRGDGEVARLALVSPGDRQIGYSERSGGGRLSFPTVIAMQGEAEPVAAVGIDLTQNGWDELVVLVRREGKGFVGVMAQPEVGDAGEWTLLSEIEVEGARRDASGLHVIPGVLEDGAPLFMVTVPREAPLFFQPGAEDASHLRTYGVDSAVRSNLLRTVQPSALTPVQDAVLGTVLIVADRGFARALRVGDEGFELIDQFNTRRNDDQIAVVIPGSKDADGCLVDLYAYVQNTGELQRLRRDQDDVFRYHSTRDVGTLDYRGWFLDEADEDKVGWLFLGSDRFWRLSPDGGARWQREPISRYENDLEGVRYTTVTPAQLAAGPAMITLDGNNNLIDILVYDEDEAGWQSRLFWRVFDRNMHFQGRSGSANEPRQVILGDWNANGLADLAVLVHDRILFFFQD